MYYVINDGAINVDAFFFIQEKKKEIIKYPSKSYDQNKNSL